MIIYQEIIKKHWHSHHKYDEECVTGNNIVEWGTDEIVGFYFSRRYEKHSIQSCKWWRKYNK